MTPLTSVKFSPRNFIFKDHTKCTSNSKRINKFEYNTLLNLHEFSLLLIKYLLQKPNIFDTDRYSSYRVTINLACVQLPTLLKKNWRGVCVTVDNRAPCINYLCIKTISVSTSNMTHGDKKGIALCT